MRRGVRGAPLLLLAALAAAGAADPPVAPAPLRGETLMSHVRVLAADSLEGRRTGEPGAEKAAAYIADAFRRAGLSPGGDSAGWYQWYEAVVGESLGTGNALAIGTGSGGGGAEGDPLAIGDDWTPFGFSESGEARDLRVLFAGYGITAPEKGYDDYAGQDARGKAVLILRYEPANADSGSAFDGTRLTSYADFRWKAWNAQNHGAAAIFFATGPGSLADSTEDVLFPLARDSGHASGGTATIPVVQIRSARAESLAARGGIELRRRQAEIDAAGAPRSGDLASVRIARLAVDLVKDRRRVANVIGILPGAGPRAESAIVLGAHYDHLGLGGEGSLAPDSSAVHNGADDNASGTAALIGIAGALAASPPPERRTMLFAAWSGEEEGLLGSAWYAKSPSIPLERTAAMINMDMVGRSAGGKIHVGGVGTAAPFRGIVAEEGARFGFRPDLSDGGFGPSDHTSFYAKGVPVLFFFTGAHEDYHKPSDDVEKILVPGLEATARLVEAVARRLAAEPGAIEFVRVASDTLARGAGEGYATGRGYGPYLGTIPDFGGYEGEGVLLSGVKTGSPAEKAGMRGGDVVVRFAGLPIANLYDYTYALRDKRPGDAVRIEVKRGEEIVTVTAVLEKRK